MKMLLACVLVIGCARQQVEPPGTEPPWVDERGCRHHPGMTICGGHVGGGDCIPVAGGTFCRSMEQADRDEGKR